MKSALVLSLFAVKAFADQAADDRAAVGTMLGNFDVTITAEDKAACCVPDGKITLTQASNKKKGATEADQIINMKANWTTTATEAASNQCTILGLVDTEKSAPVQAIFTDKSKASWDNFAKTSANWFKIHEWTPKVADGETAVKQTVGLTINKKDDFKITQDFTKKQQTIAWSADFKFTVQNAGATEKTDKCTYLVKASRSGDIFCKEGQYVGETECTKCPEHCTACKGANECTKCEAGFGIPEKTSDKKCQKCADGTWANPKTNKCQQCFGQCAKCTDDKTCLECKGNQELVNGMCKKCKDNQFFADKKCNNCPDSCLTCKDAKTCEKCKPGFGLNNGACEACKPNQFPDAKDSKCVDCPAGCTKCSDAKKCTECEKEGYELKNDQCVKKAGSGGGFGWGWAILIIVLIAIAGGAGYYFWSQQKAKKLNESLIAAHE